MQFDADLVQDLERAASREWLLVDGLGGYASSTLLGANTRRHHGLLVAATRPPAGRVVLLSKVEETLVVGDRRYELGTNFYPGAVHPRGFEHAVHFALDPLPTLTWQVEGARLTRTVARVHGEPATVLLYLYEGAAPAVLELRPLVAYRGCHSLQREDDAIRREVEGSGGEVVLQPWAGALPLALRAEGGSWASDGYWYRSFEYPRDRERGLDFREDLFSHGRFAVPLESEGAASLVAWAGRIPPAREPVSLLVAERKRLRELAGGADGLAGDLHRAADAFLVRRGEAGRTVIAGYHWPGEESRDTLIALPGLFLATGRHDEARAILREYARHVDGGLVPVRFAGAGETPAYAAADAPLWMVLAVERVAEASRDPSFGRSMLPAVNSILEGYRGGARHGIRAGADGLVSQGEPGLALTWMDARAGETPVTPRQGYAVEIQALWYNALLVGAGLARAAGRAERAAEWTALAATARNSFLRTFWSEDLGYLADVVAGGTRDLALRPNQLYAVGLPHALVPRDKAVSVLAAVKRALLTPRGLRSLAPDDPAYRPGGDASGRHQGAVWPALMGVYFDALVRVYGEEGKQEARRWLQGFSDHLQEAGLGFAGETFEGEAPHRPTGAIALAWSVAELLRVVSRLPARPPRRAGTSPV